MKRILILSCLLTQIILKVEAQVYSFNANLVYFFSDSLKTELTACFPFGNGICQIYKGSLYSIQNDTMFCNSFYDKTGVYSLFGCCSNDTIEVKGIPTGIHYFSIIENIYSKHPSTGLFDTTFSVNDTTFALFPTQEVNVEFGSEIKIYPNPILNTFEVLIPYDNTRIEIYDSYGRIVEKCALYRNSKNKFDLSKFQGNLFYIKIKSMVNKIDYKYKIQKI